MRIVARALILWFIGVVVGLLLGAATSFGQTYLPDALRPFANSNSGWTLLAFAIVVVCTRLEVARRWWLAAVLGLLVFHALLQGYAVTSTLRGFPDEYGPGDFYFGAAMIVGPMIGLAGLWWWSPHLVKRAIGTAVFAAAMIGDGVSSLIRTSATTGWLYWVVSIGIGVGVLTWAVFKRLEGPRDRAVAILGTSAGTVLLITALLII